MHNMSGIDEGTGFSFDGELTTTIVETTATTVSTEIHTELTAAGVDATADGTTLIEYEILDDPQGYFGILRDTSHLETEFLGNTTVEDTITTFNPAKVVGPSSRWCQGETWMAPSVSVTTQVNNGPPEQAMTPTEEGVVHSINETVTVPAGTFNAVHYTVTITSGGGSGSTVSVWLDAETGVEVKQEVRDPIGLIGLFLALTEVEFP